MNPLHLLCLLWLSFGSALRCYVSLELQRQISVECGISAGCLKVYVDSEDLLMRLRRKSGGNLPINLPGRFENDPVVFRGCFVLQVPDRCYSANDGYTYCWCSTKDLCNNANQPQSSLVIALLTAILITQA